MEGGSGATCWLTTGGGAAALGFDGATSGRGATTFGFSGTGCTGLASRGGGAGASKGG